MVKMKPNRKDLDSYSIKDTNKIVRRKSKHPTNSPKDYVLMRSLDSNKPSYVTRIEQIETDHWNNVKVWVNGITRQRN
ncbi:hypothetical protein U1Q18_011740 [Sarracenia purpurea var. burkii]